jgi:hypothetical protein
MFRQSNFSLFLNTLLGGTRSFSIMELVKHQVHSHFSKDFLMKSDCPKKINFAYNSIINLL